MKTPSQPIHISVQNVSVTYSNGHTALSDASFQLHHKSICALVGVNGSGKSTLFKALMGFVDPTQGSITISGESVATAQKKNWIAYVPQTEEVDWTFPVQVKEVVMMGRYGYLNFLRLSRKIDRTIVQESLERVGMWDYRDRQIGELSGGQKKRVFLARALAQQSPIILLDEPFTGVDVKTESSIIELLRDLREQGKIILVSTHNLGSVPDFCDQAILINRTVLGAGPISEIFTEANLARAFGGVLRHFHFEKSTVDESDGRSVTLLTDDERPLVFGRGGHLEHRTAPDSADINKKP